METPTHISPTPAATPHDHPLIAITGNYSEGELRLLHGYYRSLQAVGAGVVVLPPGRTIDPEALSATLDRIDGILLSGGADLNPLYIGQDPIPALHSINPERDAFELKLIELAYNRQIPMLGICRGIQMLAAALGGTLIQDLATELPHATLLKHSQDAPRGVATHQVKAEPGSLVATLFGTTFPVNSFHHQAVGQAGPKFRITARAADGVAEAMESVEPGKYIVGVQWHPECFHPEGDDRFLPLFKHFVHQAAEYRRCRTLHSRILTLDSHCDTPMLFDKHVELTQRDPQTLVDFVKMREGGLDATIMAAYLPQEALTPEGHRAATARATNLLTEIGNRVAKAPNVALACTPRELYEHKRQGKLSVMRAIENGYALGTDVSNVEHFAQMGVVYITLCHNGDNLICDSARRSETTHGGLSPFGRQVVAAMNKHGIMVDVSHAAESSFYDALEASQTPIVCSHASSRALCPHPRNLSDAQLRALSAKGGVAQVTLYHGFLRTDEQGGTATLADGVQHLLHMISVAGIDSVGIGTDFDGDGGVPGCASASELINFTKLLRAEGLTEEDLSKIWGGNFLRVMQQCQDFAHR